MSSIPSDSTQDVGAASRLPSVDVILDLTRERLNGQGAQIDALDSKANFVLTAATVLLGTALAAQVAITSQTINGFGAAVPRAAVLIALVLVYLFVVAMAFQAYGIEQYDKAPDPQKLVDDYLTRLPEETKEDAAIAMAIAFTQNRERIARKVRWTRWALKALVAESVVLVIVLILQVW